nr:hypothetical protein [Tanacetum cinerariifolium]
DSPDYLDTIDRGKQKEIKAYTFCCMESEEICEKYITPCYVEGLDVFDGITNLEYDKKLISNEFVVKLSVTYEVMKNEDDVEPCVILGRPFLKIAKENIDFGSGILIILPETMLVDSDDDGLDALLASINFDDLSPLDPTITTNFPNCICDQERLGEEVVREYKKDIDSDDDEEEEYSLKGDEYGKPFYGPHRPPYLDSEDVMDRSLAEQDYLNPFNNVCMEETYVIPWIIARFT